jgi:predicted RNA-binding protein with PUA-like domain
MSKKIAAPKILPEDSPSDARYWLVKSEPDVFSIEDLAKAKKQTTHWDGVRNYQARNTLRDSMKLGDLVLFYHSNANPPAIVGVARVVREGYPDHTALDPKSDHFDPKSSEAKPIWYMVDLQFVLQFPQPLLLPFLKQVPALKGMELLRKGSRLSVQPVRQSEFQTVLELASVKTCL